MSTRAFFAPAAQARVREAVAAVEQRTSAEIVVALRRSSGRYRDAEYATGGLCAFALLLVFLYHPDPFDFTFLPLELLACFVAAAFACAHAPPLQRLLTSRRARDENVHAAARALFVDRGVVRTTRRTGILVYLSALERQVEIVADVGIDEEALGPHWREAKARMSAALVAGSLDAFLDALRALGPALAETLPHHDGDVLELAGGEVAA
jgi:putative membrane protein